MKEKPIDWRGSSFRDIKDGDIFTSNARREAGRQLSQVQAGIEPDHWKPFNEVVQAQKRSLLRAYPVVTPNTLPIVLRSIFNYYIQCLWCGNRISTHY